MQKKSIIFVMGEQRSGSTALELAIASATGIFPAGEIRLLPREFKASKLMNKSCHCGQNFIECDFWGDVYEYVCRIEGNELRKIDLNKIYHYIFNKAGTSSIVDSSKSFRFLNLLFKVEWSYDIKVVYIRRNIFDVCTSKRKWQKKYGHELSWYFWDIGKLLWRYVVRESYYQKLRVSGRKAMKITYHELITGKQTKLQQLAEFLSAHKFDVETMDMKTLHLIAGTPGLATAEKWKLRTLRK